MAEASDAELVILPGEVNAMEGADDYFSWLDYMITHLIDAFPDNQQKIRDRDRQRRRDRKRVTK